MLKMCNLLRSEVQRIVRATIKVYILLQKLRRYMRENVAFMKIFIKFHARFALILSRTSMSAGSHCTEFRSLWLSHRADLCSRRSISPLAMEHI